MDQLGYYKRNPAGGTDRCYAKCCNTTLFLDVVSFGGKIVPTYEEGWKIRIGHKC
eukprot:UN04777